ncbi:MAG: hypothetical protein AAF789_13735, partial [Bacteroidota bacterium]
MGNTQTVISLCKELGISLLNTSFDSIYAHALVDYGITHPDKEVFQAFFSLKQTKEYVKQNIHETSTEKLDRELSGLLHTGTGKVFIQLKNESIQEDVIVKEYRELTKFIEKYTKKSTERNLPLAAIDKNVTQIAETLKEEFAKIEEKLPKQYDEDLPDRLDGIEKEIRESSLFLKLLTEKIDEAELSQQVVNQVAEKIYNIGQINNGNFNAQRDQIFNSEYLHYEDNRIFVTNSEGKKNIQAQPIQEVLSGKIDERKITYQDFLKQGLLPYVHRSVFKSWKNYPDIFIDENDILKGIEERLGSVIMGKGGMGKTRTMYEVALKAQKHGWQTLVVRPTFTEADRMMEMLSKANQRYLLVFDYIEESAGFGEVVKYLIDQRHRTHIRVLANCRNSYQGALREVLLNEGLFRICNFSLIETQVYESDYQGF